MEDSKRTRVLVVEDEAVIAALLAEVLEDTGFEVEICADGAAAIAAHERAPCRLAVVDYGLPDLNGLEVASRLRSGESGTRVILATGWGLLEEAQLEGVVDQLLSKPFNMGELIMSALRLTGEG